MKRYRKYETAHDKFLNYLVKDNVCEVDADCVDAFKKFRDHASEVEQLKLMIWDLQKDLNLETEERRKETEGLRKEMELANKKSEATEKSLRAEIELLNILSKEADEKLQNEVKTREVADKSYRAQITSLQSKHLSKTVEELRKELASLTKACDTKESKIQELVDQVGNLTVLVACLTGELLPVRKCMLIDVVRPKVVDAILGTGSSEWTPWWEFIQLTRSFVDKETKQLVTRKMDTFTNVFQALESKTTGVLHLTEDDIRLLFSGDLRREGNAAVHDATYDKLIIIVESETNVQAKEAWMRLLVYSGL
ncbi:hypothetical protein CPC08DRAFT_428196 [Agrocybe pediades]|nr:hypothetical protein CPC08DRAFT_428196 [Agrocybe pediades]